MIEQAIDELKAVLENPPSEDTCRELWDLKHPTLSPVTMFYFGRNQIPRIISRAGLPH